MKFFIAEEVRAKHPDLDEVLMPVFDVVVEKGEEVLLESDFKATIAGEDEEKFFEKPEFVAFRQFFASFGVDVKRTPPSVENLFRRYFKTGRVPQINSVVDICNKVAVETLIPTGVFDLDKIKGDMVLRFSRGGEEFHSLGGDIRHLSAGLTVIADEEKILDLFPYQDSVFQVVTEQTKNVMILADKVSGVDLGKTKKAVLEIGRLLGKSAGGRVGELFVSEVKNELRAEPVVSSGTKFAEKKRVFSGSRPTGRLHLGNYLGAIKGYIELQNRPDLDCIYSVVDLHGITTPYNKETFATGVREVVLDYLGAGLDPKKCHVMIQSAIRGEVLELAYYFATIFPVSRVEDLPTYKEKKLQHPDYVNVGLFYYPILMAADILFAKAELVPVGIDQEPHLELTREVARKFNLMFGKTFPEPKRFDTPGRYVPSLLGEGKMSKSVEGSYVSLTDNLETIKSKLAKAVTDIGKGEKFPETGPAANLVMFVEHFEGHDRAMQYKEAYKNEGLRYGDLKKELAEAIFEELRPIQERRRYFEAHPKEVDHILEEGKDYARKIADETLVEVRGKMGLVEG